MIYRGGCALMLECRPMRLHDKAIEWSAKYPEYRPVELGSHHLTLQFVGRDLSGSKAALVVVSAFAFAEETPAIDIEFTGAVEILSTRKGRYFVASVERSPALRRAKGALLSALETAGIKPRDAFGFNPHVTLAEAPPGHEHPTRFPEFRTEPFVDTSTRMLVKYGPHRMVVDLKEGG